MPEYLDTYSFQFHGMERDELECALGRYEERCRVLRRAYRHLWWRNAAIVVLGALLFIAGAIGLVWGVGAVVPWQRVAIWIDGLAWFGVLWASIKSRRWNARVERWVTEAREAGQEYDTAADAAKHAAELLRERFGEQ